MLVFLRTLPVLTALWLVGMFRLALRNPETFWYFAVAAVIGVVLALWFLVRKATLPHGRWNIFSFPLLTVVGAVGVLLFAEQTVLQWVFTLAVALIIAFHFEQLFRFTYAPTRYQPSALGNLGLVQAMLGLFFAALTLFDFQLFGSIPLWASVAIFIPLVAGWCVALLTMLDAPSSVRWSWGLTLGVVAVEFFALLVWLPAIPLVKAILLTLLTAAIVQHLRDDVTPGSASRRWTTILILLMLLCVLVTSRWFA